MSRSLTTLILLAAAPAFAADPGAFDWPQWRGPDRTGLSKETGLLKEWPEGGPKQVWKITGLGDGYSTPSIAAGRIYLMGTKGKDEHMFCRNEKDGSPVWDVKVGQETGGYPAPKSTPTIDDGFAYAVSSDGNLVSVDIASGKIKWQKSFKKDFGGQSGGWAYTESPLIDGDLLIATPGGKTAAIVAFKKKTGDVVWKTAISGIERKPPPPDGKGGKKGAPDYSQAGYSSVILAEIGGVKQYVQFLSGGVVGVNAKDGKLLWHYEEPANTTANISTPIVRDDFVFAVTSYGTGGGQAKIVKDANGFKAEQQYFLNRFTNHHGGVVLVKDHLYGTTNTELWCIDFKTGKPAWQNRCVEKGSVTYADGHLYVRSEKEKIALVEANPTKYVEKGIFTQPDRSKVAAWAHPVVANGKLYLRDWDIMLCYDVKGK
ncbi:MAG TPA: PQQ-binding-like beta-propeller repeat protein [Gemmataceae bacterium]|nr:PQQ-binding-like beta-propeller repeat protein [Gemmataceae bacterium]